MFSGRGFAAAAIDAPGHGGRPRTETDERIDRHSGLALVDAFASKKKSLHANAGTYKDVPAFEADSVVRFFTRHLHQTVTPSV